jgi:hypothetical protein
MTVATYVRADVRVRHDDRTMQLHALLDHAAPLPAPARDRKNGSLAIELA